MKSFVAERIRLLECQWVKYRTIPEGGQAKNARIACMPEDQGTCMAMDEYISSAGKHANSDGLAQAVTDYWQTLQEEDNLCCELESAYRELAPRTA